jgi:hypothetical protein
MHAEHLAASLGRSLSVMHQREAFEKAKLFFLFRSRAWKTPHLLVVEPVY